MAAPRTQGLLRRPERVIAVLRPDDQQVHEVYAGGGERRGIRDMRRGNPYCALSCARERRQRGQDQPQLTNAGAVVQHLCKCLAGPAATG